MSQTVSFPSNGDTASGYLASLIATQILLRVASAPERRVEVSLALEVSA